MDLKIRELTKEDFRSDRFQEQLSCLMQESEEANYPKEPIGIDFGNKEYDRLKQYRISDNARVAVIMDLDMICSYIWYFVIEGRVHINEVATFKKYQGRGYGKSLIRHVLDFASNNGIDTVQLHVLETNEAALNLYSSLGFVTEKRLMRKDV